MMYRFRIVCGRDPIVGPDRGWSFHIGEFVIGVWCSLNAFALL
jgi:hypothetical protein